MRTSSTVLRELSCHQGLCVVRVFWIVSGFIEGRLWLAWLLMVCDLPTMQRATVFDGLSFDPFAFDEDRLAAPKLSPSNYPIARPRRGCRVRTALPPRCADDRGGANYQIAGFAPQIGATVSVRRATSVRLRSYTHPAMICSERDPIGSGITCDRRLRPVPSKPGRRHGRCSSSSALCRRRIERRQIAKSGAVAHVTHAM